MEIVRKLAGYSVGRSDIVRAAMSKKKAKLMEYERDIFINGNKREIEEKRAEGVAEDKLPAFVPGCIANGIPEKIAEEIYNRLMEFASYGFNKAHAVCYAYLAYETAYLKTYYPVEFMASLLSSEIGNVSKLSGYMVAARQLGIKILPPDINKSGLFFEPEGDGIRFPLTAIKGIGYPVVSAIEKMREEGGNFKNYEDFLRRVSGTQVGKHAVEAIIKAGALSCLGSNIRLCIETFEGIMDSFANANRGQISGQLSFFDMDKMDETDVIGKLPDVEEYDNETRLLLEKEVLGIYVSGHPLDGYMDLIGKYITADSTAFATSSDEDEEESDGTEPAEKSIKNGTFITVAGIAKNVTQRVTKNGDLMAVLTLEDMAGDISAVVFPKTFDKYAEIIREDEKLFIRGRYDDTDDRGAKIIAADICTFENAESMRQKKYTSGPEQRQPAPRTPQPAPANRVNTDFEPPKPEAVKSKSDIPSKGLFVRFENMKAYEQGLPLLEETLATVPGEDKCILFISDRKLLKNLDTKVKISDDLLKSLYVLFGRENVAIK
jgi:DNA polymerase-3 subunit alpha